MKKKNSRSRWNVIALIAIFIAVVFTNVAWYSHVQQSDSRDTELWLKQEIEIETLKACFESSQKPCDIHKQPGQ